jgi:hypothetical protein
MHELDKLSLNDFFITKLRFLSDMYKQAEAGSMKEREEQLKKDWHEW